MTARHLEPLRPALVLGALFALLAVMAGAFGAHGLRGVIDERGLEVFQTAVTYQIYHSLALILVAILPVAGLSRRLPALRPAFLLPESCCSVAACTFWY